MITQAQEERKMFEERSYEDIYFKLANLERDYDELMIDYEAEKELSEKRLKALRNLNFLYLQAKKEIRRLRGWSK